MISKSNERAARVRFEITSMMITSTLLLQYAIEQRATFNQVARALFLVTRKLLESTVSQTLTRAPRQPYYIHFEIAQIQDLVDSNILLMQY